MFLDRAGCAFSSTFGVGRVGIGWGGGVLRRGSGEREAAGCGREAAGGGTLVLLGLGCLRTSSVLKTVRRTFGLRDVL